jgi:hypothetical protein
MAESWSERSLAQDLADKVATVSGNARDENARAREAVGRGGNECYGQTAPGAAKS